jgi:hypothetical protein
MKALWLAAGLLLLSATALAVDRIQLSWEHLEGAAPPLQVQQAAVTLDWSPTGRPLLRAEAAALQIGDQRLEQLSLSCELELRARDVDCRRGQLSFRSDWLTVAAAPAAIHYQAATGELRVAVDRLAVAGGRLDLTFQHSGDHWTLDAVLTDTTLAGLADLAAKAGLATGGFTFQGQLDGTLRLQGDATGLTRVGWQLATRAAGYSNAEGSQAAETLVLESSGSAAAQTDGWRIQTTLDATQGGVYAEPVYVEFSAGQPLSLTVDMHWRRVSGELSVDSLVFAQTGVASGRLSARLEPSASTPLRQLQLDLTEARLPGIYTTWLQPWLAGTALAHLDTSGRLRGQLSLQDDRPQALQLQLEQVSVEDRDGQFAVKQLDGDIHWDRREPRRSSLAWQGVSLYQLQFGAARLALETRADGVKMLSPLVVPLFDGELHIDALEAAVRDGQTRWLLDALLTPVSMARVSEALGWPPLTGTLSGMIPKVRYENAELTLGGVLLVQAFDGDITVRDLRIREPLGRVPRLWADIRLRQLDLAKLTEAFSFGRIEGRLEGRVTDLYMEAWKPVAFDARFATPADDRSRHRISQRAVDNISNLGGAGVGGALSRSFLRFLRDFPYQQLGISCRLTNGVCFMGGVAPAEQGYYLVQGRFMPPRLDVIGYADKVDWPTLIERLTAITSGQAPTVQ